MNGCHNTPLESGYWVQDGYVIDATGRPISPKYNWVEDRMSKECRYDKREQDAGCKGCEK